MEEEEEAALVYRACQAADTLTRARKLGIVSRKVGRRMALRNPAEIERCGARRAEIRSCSSSGSHHTALCQIIVG